MRTGEAENPGSIRGAEPLSWVKNLEQFTGKKKIKSEQFQKETVLLPLLSGLALVMILAAVIAGIRSISSDSADGLMESRAASASDSSA